MPSIILAFSCKSILLHWKIKYIYFGSSIIRVFIHHRSALLHPNTAIYVISNRIRYIKLCCCHNLIFLYFTYGKGKKRLSEQSEHLIKHDSLTGLFNFEECHKQIEALIENQTSHTFFLIDCEDVRSLNHETGGGSKMLVKIAQSLDQLITNAHMIARYSGDQFALAIKIEEAESTITQVKECLRTEIPQLLGVQLTYGHADFPKDGGTKEKLISVAESNLNEKKRKLWLKREEQMLSSEKLKVVGELAAGMAHEIRNPITTVKGFLQMSKANDYNVEQWYELMMGEITRVSELTSEFLQFSKPQASQFKRHSIDECIQRVIQLTESEIVAQGHQLKYGQTEAPMFVLMDRDKMVQVLLNLVKNGIEAMEECGSVTIRLKKQRNEGIIEVEDTGCGIPEALVSELFHPFFTTKENGTGLGLSICHKIIQDHGGTIRVEAQLKKGSRFRITLPLLNNSL